MSEVYLQGAYQEIVSDRSIRKYILIISFSSTDVIGKQITKECGKIFPLQNVMIRKVKLLKKPKFDLTKLMELYQERPELEIKGKKEGEEKKEEPTNLLKK